MAKTLIILMFPWQFIPLAKDIVMSFVAMAISVGEIQLGQESVVSTILKLSLFPDSNCCKSFLSSL